MCTFYYAQWACVPRLAQFLTVVRINQSWGWPQCPYFGVTDGSVGRGFRSGAVSKRSAKWVVN
jgi:hypothetical protein